jgi:hypothetical protein
VRCALQAAHAALAGFLDSADGFGVVNFEGDERFRAVRAIPRASDSCATPWRGAV